MEFHKTTVGRKYYEVDIPRMIATLDKIANALVEQNLLEKQKIKEEKKRILNEKSQ